MVNDFGARLQALRKQKKLSQEQVAKRLDVSRSTIASYENNKAFPSADILVGMALLFNVSIDYLMGLEKRAVITLDGLTKRQETVVTNIVEMMMGELRRTGRK